MMDRQISNERVGVEFRTLHDALNRLHYDLMAIINVHDHRPCGYGVDRDKHWVHELALHLACYHSMRKVVKRMEGGSP
jgi:hypothetical protein